MRIIALMNQKGGVGKTTTTVNLGAAMAKLGKKVCLIDMDPQAHLTINYGVDPSPDMVSLYEVLIEDRPIEDAIKTLDSGILLVPSSINLAAAEIELVSVIGRETLLKMRLEAANLNADYVLLDCPPSLGLLTLNALSCASHVIIPMQPHFLALQGVGKLLETVQLVQKRMNPKLLVAGIVLTLFDSNAKLSNEVVGDLQTFMGSATGKNLPWSSAKIFNSRIRRNIKLAESPSFGQNIFQYEPSSNGAADYLALGKEIIELFEPKPVEQTAPAPVVEPAVSEPLTNP
jgi:chromosome partitioning protein